MEKPSSIVKRSFFQSIEQPSRRNCCVISPPLWAFQSHTFATKSSRAKSVRFWPCMRHLPLDHHLRGDAGMVGADHPERILALQPGMPRENILQRIVERMADVQRARHVGRRVDDRPRLRAGTIGAEQAVRLPMRVPTLLEFGGVEGFGEFAHAPRLPPHEQMKRAARCRTALAIALLVPIRPHRAAPSWAAARAQAPSPGWVRC